MAIKGEPTTLNPVLGQTLYDTDVDELIFDGLLKWEHGDLAPALAAAVPTTANGGISADGRTITFHLRRNVTWQDGVPFTSADVDFTYREIMNPAVASLEASAFTDIAAVRTPDAYTVVVRLKRPSAAVLNDLSVFIVPKHLLGGTANIRRSQFSTHPIGTGPYRLVSWHHGDGMTFAANAAYFAAAPRTRTLKIRFVSNQSTNAAMLKEGTLDIAAVNSAEFRDLEKTGDFTAIPGERATLVFLIVNQKNAQALSTPAVRRALAYAIDRSHLAKDSGNTRTEASMIASTSWAYEGDGGCPTYNPKHAIDLLESNGWHNAGRGTRERHGRPLEVRLVYPMGSQLAADTALQLQGDWRRIGFAATLQGVPLPVYFSSAGPPESGRFQVALQFQGLGDDPAALSYVVGSKAWPPNGSNDARYSNAVVDEALADADSTYSLARRKSYYASAEKQLCIDLPIIPLLRMGALYAVNRRIHGFPQGASLPFDDAYRWYLSP